MVGKSEKSDLQDQKIEKHVTEFVNELDNPKEAFWYLKALFGLNIVVWLLVIIFPNYSFSFIERLIDAGNKFSALILGIPFGLGLFLTYTILRLKFPDVEENKMLDSKMRGASVIKVRQINGFLFG